MRVELQPAELSATPGQPVVFSIEVLNTAPVIEAYAVRMLGLDPTWVRLELPDAVGLSLFPGARGVVTAIITLPEGFPAGTHRFSVQVYAVADERDYHLTQLHVHVGANERLEARLEPAVLTTSRRARFGVVIANTGNVQTVARPDLSEQTEDLSLRFEPSQATVEPGEHATLTIWARGRRPWFGTPAVHQLSFALQGADGRYPINGTMLQRPRISRGVVALFGLLVAVTTFGLVLSSGFGDVVEASKVDEDVLVAAMDDGVEEATMAAMPTMLAGTVSVAAPGTGAVAGATVELFSVEDRASARYQAASADDGAFGLSAVAPGRYKMRTLAAGYHEVWFPDAVTFDAAAEIEVVLQQQTQGLDVALRGRAGGVIGKLLVSGAAGTEIRLLGAADPVAPGDAPQPRLRRPAAQQGPGPGAVQSAALAEVAATVALADGTFRFENVPSPADYQLEIRKAGFATEVRPLRLDAGQILTGLEIPLRRGAGAIAGTVSSAAGLLGGVTVSLSDGTLTFHTTTLTAGAVGAFRFDELVTPATYTMQFSRAGLRSEIRTVALEPGQQLSDLAIILTPGTVDVAGVVRDAGGVPLGGVLVRAVAGATMLEARSASSGTVGAFLLAGLPAPGSYTVTFERVGYVGASVHLELAPPVEPAATGAAPPVPPLEVALNPATANVRGTVTSGGVGLGGVQITLTDGTITRTITSADAPAGVFRLDGIPPGTYQAMIGRLGSTERTETVTLTAGQDRTLDVALSAGITISGQVVYPGFVAAAGAEVRLYLASAYPGTAVRRAIVDSDGLYSFVGLPSPQTLVLEFAAAPGAVVAGSATRTVLAGQSLTVNFAFGAPP
ncbi:MAG: carboxypeptidase regulatory-like domain-containing protein [Acidimicrobiales bacterium]